MYGKQGNLGNSLVTSLIGSLVLAVAIAIVNNFYDSDIKKKGREVFWVSFIGSFIVLFVSSLFLSARLGRVSRKECHQMCRSFPLAGFTSY